MLKLIKFALITLLTLIACACALAYFGFTASLPQLDGDKASSHLQSPASLSRDSLGQAVINAETKQDAAYLLGFAHAQDRLFQMDTQRRAASGRLSELLGNLTVDIDKAARFFQFERRAKQALASLPTWQQTLLNQYAAGVNDAVDDLSVLPFEYLLTQSTFAPWRPEDSLLVIYSMYMDLQLSQVDRDLAFTRIAHHFGSDMVDFILQPSHHQAALDGSILVKSSDIPQLPKNISRTHTLLKEPVDIGSNNWAVSGELTDSQSAMLANDMHLSLRIPIIWYRAQLNYTSQQETISVTGVSLPGIPGIVVGTNGYIAWGFTNANLDNTDWVRLDNDTPVTTSTVEIAVADGNAVSYELSESEYSPVREVNGERYSLSWAALQPYAANLNVVDLATAKSANEAMQNAHLFGIPVQNLMLADSIGNIAWTAAGAVTARKMPSDKAISLDKYDPRWETPETQLPHVINPPNNRLWTANARVISADDFARFGDGGYAVGARGEQIRDRLFDYKHFDEARFYSIQLDNEARFLIPWYALLYRLLSNRPDEANSAFEHVKNWRSCACPDSVGYTLVRRFRSQVISALYDPIATALASENVNFSPVLRHIEPSTWDLINAKPRNWLPGEFSTWDDFLFHTFEKTLTSLKHEYGDDPSLQQLPWGEVNRLTVKHPLSDAIPLIGHRLNMVTQAGFGDSYMPSVQASTFGASQRLFVRPGDLDKAVLTLPGGQSGHPLSPFYRAGFDDYIHQRETPLLPQTLIHELRFSPGE